MDKIVINGFVYLLDSLDFKELVSDYLIKFVTGELSNNK
jgi:hypothetical protein